MGAIPSLPAARLGKNDVVENGLANLCITGNEPDINETTKFYDAWNLDYYTLNNVAGFTFTTITYSASSTISNFSYSDLYLFTSNSLQNFLNDNLDWTITSSFTNNSLTFYFPVSGDASRTIFAQDEFSSNMYGGNLSTDTTSLQWIGSGGGSISAGVIFPHKLIPPQDLYVPYLEFSADYTSFTDRFFARIPRNATFFDGCSAIGGVNDLLPNPFGVVDNVQPSQTLKVLFTLFGVVILLSRPSGPIFFVGLLFLLIGVILQSAKEPKDDGLGRVWNADGTLIQYPTMMQNSMQNPMQRTLRNFFSRT